MANESRYKMSSERLAALKEELQHLDTVGMKEAAERIKEARAFGDLSENSEYDEAKNEQGKIASRIAELKDLIEHAIITEKSEEHADVVTIGSKVKLKDMQDKSEEVYQIVGSQEIDPMNGLISDDSPIGHAIKGHRAGDTVIVEAPAGELKFKIIEVIND